VGLRAGRPQVANKRVSVFAKITGIGAKEDKKDLQAARADHTANSDVAYRVEHAVWPPGGHAVLCGAVRHRFGTEGIQEGPDAQGKAGSGNGTV
jgi:hypothetical protein